MTLLNQFDADFKRKHKSQLIDAYDATYREAVKLMASSELKVFDISEENEDVREKYGNNRFGQGVLLARRLVEKGVRFVEVEYAGRDHHPGAFSALMCGSGVKGGQVYGASDKLGHKVESDPVYPEDFNATVAAAMGLPLDKEFIAPNGRPFRICDSGKPISKLLA
jgi:Protein of unknown function (DUF1501)